MAKVIDTYTREDGHIIDEYESGAQYDRTAGRLARPAGHTLITAEKATVYNRRRQEKAAAELRRRIRLVASGRLEPVRTSAEAFAESGALLFDEVVLNPDAYPRDRLETWEKLGRYAGVLADPRQPAAGSDPDAGARLAALTAAANVEAARILAKVFADVKQAQADTPQAIEGKVTG